MSHEEQIAQAAQEAAQDVRQEDAERAARTTEEKKKKRKSLDSPLLLAALLVTLVALTAINLTGHGMIRKPPPATPAEVRADVGEEVDQIAMELEATVEAVGELPESIDHLVPPATERFSYQKLDAESYRLSLTLDGETVEHDAGG